MINNHEINEYEKFGKELEINLKTMCYSLEDIRSSIININVINKNRVINRLNQYNHIESEIFSSFSEQFSRYVINGHYSVKKEVFKTDVLQKLLKNNNNNPKIQTSSLLLLEKILFDDWKLNKGKLSIIAVKAQLIIQLSELYAKYKDLSVRKSIYRLYLLLLFVISSDSQKLRNLILNSDNFITVIIENLNETCDEIITKDSLLIMQFFSIYCKNYDKLSPILSSIIKFIKHTDRSIVFQSCQSLLIFSQNCRNARFSIIQSAVSGKLIELLIDCNEDHNDPEEDVIKPLIGLLITFLPLSIRYKNAFLDANLLSVITKYMKSCECHRVFACDITKMICLAPICSKLYKPTNQIQILIKNQTLVMINELLENDNIISVKSSALNALFVSAYNSTIEQLNELSDQGCLKSVCSQLESTHNEFLHKCLLTIVVFLFAEFKEILKNIKIYPNPKKSLTKFSKILKENNVIEILKDIIERKKKILEKNPYNKRLERIRILCEEILIHSFGIETRDSSRIPATELMKYKKSLIDCVSCLKKTADTMLFPCEHVVNCHECATKSLYKIYVTEKVNKCPLCKSTIPLLEGPWIICKNQIFMNYKEIEDEILFEPLTSLT